MLHQKSKIVKNKRRISQSEIRNSAAAEMKTPSPKPARIPPQTQYERITGFLFFFLWAKNLKIQ